MLRVNVKIVVGVVLTLAVLGRLDQQGQTKYLVERCGGTSADNKLPLVDNLKDAPDTQSGFLRLNEKTLHEKLAAVKTSNPLDLHSMTKQTPRFWAAIYGRLELEPDRRAHLIFAENTINY